MVILNHLKAVLKLSTYLDSVVTNKGKLPVDILSIKPSVFQSRSPWLGASPSSNKQSPGHLVSVY